MSLAHAGFGAGIFFRLKPIIPYLVTAVLFAAGMYALYRLLAPVSLRDVMQQARATPASTVALALLATFAGYAALLGYDWSALSRCSSSIRRNEPCRAIGSSDNGECEIGLGGRPRQVVDTATADPEHPRLAAEAQPMITVDHRFALGNRPFACSLEPMVFTGSLPSAPDKKSFSSVSSPILPCSVFTSTAGAASAVATAPNTPEAPSRSCERHCVIWFG